MFKTKYKADVSHYSNLIINLLKILKRNYFNNCHFLYLLKFWKFLFILIDI